MQQDALLVGAVITQAARFAFNIVAISKNKAVDGVAKKSALGLAGGGGWKGGLVWLDVRVNLPPLILGRKVAAIGCA